MLPVPLDPVLLPLAPSVPVLVWPSPPVPVDPLLPPSLLPPGSSVERSFTAYVTTSPPNTLLTDGPYSRILEHVFPMYVMGGLRGLTAREADMAVLSLSSWPQWHVHLLSLPHPHRNRPGS